MKESSLKLPIGIPDSLSSRILSVLVLGYLELADLGINSEPLPRLQAFMSEGCRSTFTVSKPLDVGR